MNFSYRRGANWCHDFPKLAKESGFHFNIHRSKLRLDWNRISTVDIDRVIKERDFLTVDENINNVIDYNLESEYDVKILDSNFVKLFRLAQLSVEYLLYCKQYLDHSVIIMKDELRSKVDENVKLKNELLTAENCIKELNEKLRDKNKLIEKSFNSSQGEIHKCPHCPKMFGSAVYTNSHISRRHSNISLQPSVSSIHEQYKEEAEKLYSEIKTLKERLNETEKIIRNESNKLSDHLECNNEKNDRKILETKGHDKEQDKKIEEEHKMYREEISNLKTMFFSELQNLKQIEINNSEEEGRKQENEIKQLRKQVEELSKKNIPNIESIQTKLQSQEEYWKLKLEQLEFQHRKDKEELSVQLNLTKESAECIKQDYLRKINELEEKAKINAEKLVEKLPVYHGFEQQKTVVQRDKSTQWQSERSDVEISEKNPQKIHDSLHKKVVKISDDKLSKSFQPKSKLNQFKAEESYNSDEESYESSEPSDRAVKPKRKNIQRIIVQDHKSLVKKVNVASRKGDESEVEERKDEMKGKSVNKSDMISSFSQSDETEVTSESESSEDKSDEELSDEEEEDEEDEDEDDEEDEDEDEEESEEDGETSDESSQEEKRLQHVDNVKSKKQKIQKKTEEAFEMRLKSLGIDPEWQGIPKNTYKQLEEVIKHKREMNSKKYSKFEETRRKMMQHIMGRVNLSPKKNKKINKDDELVEEKSKQSSLNKLMSNVKMKAIKAFKSNQSSETNLTNEKQKTKIHEGSPVNKLNFELLPKKLTQSEIRDAKVVEVEKYDGKKSFDMKSSLSLSTDERYTATPKKPANVKPQANSKTHQDLKHLSHSYESIKDYLRDSNSSISLLQTKAPRNTSSPILPASASSSSSSSSSSPSLNKVIEGYSLIRKRVGSDELSPNHSNQPKFKSDRLSLPNSPKNHNKSVLKSSGSVGSTGNFIKKKVIFDLESSTETNTLNSKVSETKINDNDQHKDNETNKSESDFEISSISAEVSLYPKRFTIKSSDNDLKINPKSDRIAELSRKIEAQLNSTPHYSDNVKKLFTDELKQDEDDKLKNLLTSSLIESYKDNTNTIEVNKTNPGAMKIPKPTPRTSKLNHRSISSDLNSDDLNLDMEIDELLSKT